MKVELFGLRLEPPVCVSTFLVWASSDLTLCICCSAPSYIADSRSCPETQGDSHLKQDLQRQGSLELHGGGLFPFKAQNPHSGPTWGSFSLSLYGARVGGVTAGTTIMPCKDLWECLQPSL